MNNKLNTLKKFYVVTLFIVFIFIAPVSSLGKKDHKVKESTPRPESCLKLGQGEILNDNKAPTPCCKPLKGREAKDICGVPSGGGEQRICLACGDGKCDPELENTCNCPEDCKE